MSDSREPDERTPEQLGVDAALAVLEGQFADLEARLLAGDEPSMAVRRQQLEALSLLAWELPAVPASAAHRDRLMARLQGDETVMVPWQVVASVAAPAGVAAGASHAGPHGVLDPPAPPRASDVTTAPLLPGSADRARRASAVAPLTRPAVRTYRWALPLAAAFALAAIGLAFHDRQVSRELEGTRQALAAARQQGEQLAARLHAGDAASVDTVALHDKMREMARQLSMVTATATAVCPMRPAQGAPARDAGGMLYVAADHQHWYLRAENLPHPGEGRVYQLWFLVDKKPVSAGSFQLVGNEAVLSSPTMPKGTSAALVTVEPAGGAGDRPSGPVVLYGRNIAPLL